MNNAQPVFIAKRQGRKAAYSVSTSIYREANKFVVYKEPMDKTALDHIHHMSIIHAQLKSLIGLDSKISLIPITVTGTVAKFPFIKGHELERAVLEALLNNNETFVLEVLQRFTEILEPFEQKIINPITNSEFTKIFGHNWDETALCILPGYVDLTMDNIIIDESNKWFLIDYEWLFDFPIPAEFVIGRMLWWFFGARYGNILREHSERLPLIEIGNGTVIPRYVYKAFKQYFDQLDKILVMEAAFQTFVTGKAVDYSDRFLFKKPRDVKRPLNLIEDFLAVKSNYLGIENQLKEAHSLLESMSKEHAALIQEHQSITRSRSYRALQKARHLKRKLKP